MRSTHLPDRGPATPRRLTAAATALALAAGALLATSSASAAPTCTTLTLAAGGEQDVILLQSSADTNWDGYSMLVTGVSKGGSLSYTLIRNDLSSIPKSALVTSAVVSVTENNSCSKLGTVNAHQILGGWNPNAVTWDDFTAGYSATVLSSQAEVVATPSSTTVLSFDVASLAQSWVDGSVQNDGVLLEQAAGCTYYDNVVGPSLDICFVDNCDPSPCGNGTCTSTASGYTCACDPGFTGPSCQTCTNAGYADCDGNPANGCETALNTDANCGACGAVCAPPNAAGSCAAGSCAIGSCDAGYADCDGNPADGCETNTASDVDNCGACGALCVLPNAIPACSGGACAVAACDAGYGDCDGNPANGCETVTASDVDNCGACGLTCALANAIPQCSGGACAVASCNPGFSDCDGNPADGCETNTASDVNNCGACGAVCSLANATSTCGSGSCAIVSCNPGHYDCDGNPANGCEATSCANGQQCTSATACQSGVCTGGVCVAPASCAAATESGNCNLGATNSGGGSGSCAAGFGAGSCSYTCFNGTWTQVADTCAPAACSAAIENSNCNVGATNSGGTSGTCAAGFGAGSCSYACTNGAWTKVSDTCAPAACTAGTDNNCVLATTTSGNTDTGSCASGYTGACSFSCSNGAWTQVANTCAAQCTAATESGNCDVSLTNSGGTSGSCASGFGSGSCSYACANGAWTKVSDTCAPAACTAATENGNCNVSAVGSGSNSGTCASGFGAGSCSYTCTNGAWTQVSDTCAPAACAAGTDNNCVLTTTTSGSTDTGSCAGGYTGACSFSCSNGAWTQVADTCALGCVIGGTTVAAGTVNPSNSCQACQPTLSSTAYTNVTTGGNTTTCKASSGDVCNGSGTCVSDCYINGALVTFGTYNPTDGCQFCVPTTSTTSYTAVTNGTNTATCLASAGDVCEGGNCVCNSTGGLVNCSGVCVSESNDPNNCGACGHKCATGQVCASGVCSTAFTNSKIAVGATFACAVVNGGEVMCWGATSTYGSNPAYLGDGNTAGSTTPVAVTGITTAEAVFAAAFNACALLSNGTVECWGDNVSGQLGDGTTTNRTSPVAVSGLTNAVAVAGNTYPGGPSFSCAVESTGNVECWGDNSEGELGNGTTTSSLTPVTVSGLNNAIAIATGADFACALQQGGTVVCWGDAAGGALGNGATTGFSATPVAVSGITNAVGVSADYESACAVLSNGDVECWGYNGNDALGDNSTSNSTTPVAVYQLTDGTAIVACDGSSVSSVCAATTAGTAYCWGDNTSGQLGNDTETSSDVPVQVKGLSGAVQISIGGGAGTGQASACALLSNGSVECWGSNAYGQLGNGTNTSSLSPVTVIDL